MNVPRRGRRADTAAPVDDAVPAAQGHADAEPLLSPALVKSSAQVKSPAQVKVIPLRDVPAGEFPAGRSRTWEAAWRLVEWAVVTNPLQPSSALRAAALRAFGADIGRRVIIRPRVRVRFPWNLSVGDDCWIGEGVWFSNRDKVRLEADVVLSQETFITTGSHATTTDMHETSAPVVFRSGTWVTSRCVVLGGVETGISSLITPGTVVAEPVPAGMVYGQGKPRVIRPRFSPGSSAGNPAGNPAGND